MVVSYIEYIIFSMFYIYIWILLYTGSSRFYYLTENLLQLSMRSDKKIQHISSEIVFLPHRNLHGRFG